MGAERTCDDTNCHSLRITLMLMLAFPYAELGLSVKALTQSCVCLRYGMRDFDFCSEIVSALSAQLVMDRDGLFTESLSVSIVDRLP